MTDSKQSNHLRTRRTGVDAAFTQYMEGDAATGGNTGYGNTSGNQGAKLVAASPEEEPPGKDSPRA